MVGGYCPGWCRWNVSILTESCTGQPWPREYGAGPTENRALESTNGGKKTKLGKCPGSRRGSENLEADQRERLSTGEVVLGDAEGR